MHRSYRPVKPTHSKLLQRRWDEAYYEEHRRRVAAARAEVDTRPPPTYIHLHLKMKKLQMEEERMATIDRDNRILLQKMSDTSRTQGRVDHRNNYESKSLNYDRRTRELMRITKENQELLKRLDASRPKYDREMMDKDWQANLRYINQISTYPENWWLERSATTMTAANKSKSRRSNHKDSKVQRSKSVEQPSKERKASAKNMGNENSSASKKAEE